MSRDKWQKIQEEATDAGLSLEDYLDKKNKHPEKPKTKPPSRSRQMAAISWEAERRGTSYGKLVGMLTLPEKEKIYKSFEEYQAKREATLAAEPLIIIEKTKHTGPQPLTIRERRFDPSLTNSTENTEVTETLGD